MWFKVKLLILFLLGAVAALVLINDSRGRVQSEIAYYRTIYKENINTAHSINVLNEFDAVMASNPKIAAAVGRASKDPFALAALAFSSTTSNRAEALRKAADAGDSVSQAVYGQLLYFGIGIEKDSVNGLRYILLSAESGNYFAFKHLIDLSAGNSAYCGYLHEGFALFGFDIFSDLILEHHEKLVTVESNCKIFKIGGVYDRDNISETLFDMNTSDEMGFIKGVYYLKQTKYTDAARIFYDLRISSNNTIAANAQYCLGTLYANGTGVAQNTEKSEIYFQSAYSKGMLIKSYEKFAKIPFQRVVNHSASYYCSSGSLEASISKPDKAGFQ